MNVSRAIRRHFGVKVQGDLLPITSKRGTRLTLANCWNDLGYRRGVEIGVMRGEYSLELLKRIPQLHLTCIDPWTTYDKSQRTTEMQEKNYQIATDRLTSFIADGRCVVRREYSLVAVKDFQDQSLDFVFIDGDHTFDHAVRDIIEWSYKVRSGGMVAVHDYCPMRHGGVMKAVEAYVHCHHIDPWYVAREQLPTAFWVKP